MSCSVQFSRSALIKRFFNQRLPLQGGSSAELHKHCCLTAVSFYVFHGSMILRYRFEFLSLTFTFGARINEPILLSPPVSVRKLCSKLHLQKTHFYDLWSRDVLEQNVNMCS